MAASTGALAAEHARLEAERARLEEELAALSVGLPDGAADVVARAEAILSAHAEKVAAVRSALNQIDEAFGVRRRQQAEAEAAARRERYGELVGELRAAEDARCAAIDKLEHHIRAVRDAVKEAFTQADAVRAAAKELSTMAGVERPSLLRLNQKDFSDRCGGRMSAVMSTLGLASRLAGISWGVHSLHDKDEQWAELERAHFKVDLDKVIKEAQ